MGKELDNGVWALPFGFEFVSNKFLSLISMSNSYINNNHLMSLGFESAFFIKKFSA